jgi:putative DNA primase/helicase
MTAGKVAFSAAVERFAQRDPRHAVTADIWDKDLFLLGTPRGVIDLKSGKMRLAVPDDCVTRLAAVAPNTSGGCPTWHKFLAELTCGDDETVEFLKRWAGYCLTGATTEHALVFCYGPGGNGKSVFLNTMAGILGDYSASAAMDTFTTSTFDKHPTDLAMLRGARLVTASETEDGRSWAESRIKQMTGGDLITARFMRQDFFTYRPQFKLTLVGNHKPLLRNVDDAARRRFNIVPMLQKPKRVDQDLEAKLVQEWPAILAWMIEGCLSWQENRLPTPPAIVAATADYFESNDLFSQWMAHCCEKDATAVEPPSDLMASYVRFCEANGDLRFDPRRLKGYLQNEPGVRYVKRSGRNLVRGLKLLNEKQQHLGLRTALDEERGTHEA